MWPLQSECAAKFGNPTSPGWAEKWLVQVPVPWAMKMGTMPIKTIRVNKIAADSLDRVLKSLWRKCDMSQAKIHAAHCDCFSGCFAVRSIRGKSTPSMHSYGLAIDFDAQRNALGAPATGTFFQRTSLLPVEFMREGWTWGGNWRGRRDAMHVQAARVG